MITITANTRQATVTNKELLTTGSAGIQVQFTLSDDFNSLAKMAVFREGEDGEKVDVILDENLTCVVPHEVLTEEDEPLFIGIYGANELGTIIIPTVWAAAGVVKPGTEPNTPADAEPTPEIWAAILSTAQNAETIAGDALTIAEQADAASTAAIDQCAADKTAAVNARDAAIDAKVAAEVAAGNSIDARDTSITYSRTSEAYAVGKREGVDVASDDPAYHNNSKYYAESIAGDADAAAASALVSEGWALGKQNGESVTSGSPYYHANANYYKQQASSSASSASNSAGAASTYKLQSEGFAVGQQNGTDVGSSSTYYHNNASYYATQADNSASSASGSASDASGSASSAETNALKAEGYAVGKQNGSDVSSGSTYYHNNASYYSGHASTSATNAGSSATSAAADALKAEGWAKGTQNGTAVSSGTYYQDNAKYYKEQAASSATAAADSAGDASDSATAAANSASDAADSATAAEAAVNSKAPVIVETATGSIASFTDGADGMPIKNLVVDVESVQDLHGYANPWPAGGGKNLMGLQNTGTITNGVSTLTYNRDSSGNLKSVTLNTTARESATVMGTERLSLPAGTYIVSGNPSKSANGCSIQIRNTANTENYAVAGDNERSFTFSEETEFDVRFYVPSGVAINNLVWYPMIRKSTDPSGYVPYSNICPISGWTGAQVRGNGKNLMQTTFPDTRTTNGVTFVKNADGSLTVSGEPSGTAYTPGTTQAQAMTNGAFFLPAGEYILKGYGNNGVIYPWLMTFDINGNYIEAINTAGGDNRFTINKPRYVFLRVYAGQDYDGTETTIYPALYRFEDVPNEWEPYKGTVKTITFPAGAGTVYGGTITQYADGTGKLVVDKGIEDLGDMSWTHDSHGFMRSASIQNDIAKPAESTFVLDGTLCSHLVVVSANAIYNGADGIGVHIDGQIRAKYPNMSTTSSTFANDVSGWKLVYPLATPVEYTLTAEQIGAILTTLKGVNNVWADTGDVELDYCADTKTYIDNLVAQAIASI